MTGIQKNARGSNGEVLAGKTILLMVNIVLAGTGMAGLVGGSTSGTAGNISIMLPSMPTLERARTTGRSHGSIAQAML